MRNCQVVFHAATEYFGHGGASCGFLCPHCAGHIAPQSVDYGISVTDITCIIINTRRITDHVFYYNFYYDHFLGG